MTAEREVRVVAAGRLQPRRRPDPEPAVEPAAVVELGRPAKPSGVKP